MFDVLVIGKGLFGSAATRHLSEQASSVGVIGPDEPADPSTHDGVFSSHYDQGRLQRHLSRDVVWATLSHRSQAQYDRLTKQSGISFYQPVDSVHLVPRAKDSLFVRSAVMTAERLGVAYTLVESGRELDAKMPMLHFPAEVRGYIEHYPAGYINPRDLIRAQLRVAAQQGATVITDTVASIQDEGSHVTVTTRGGERHAARKVLVATGAYADGLLPRRLAVRVKGEIIILARLPPREVERLAGMPSMIYEITEPPIETIYMLPPIRYPDGHHYIKMGCNTPFDTYLSTAEDMNRWVRSGESDVMKTAMAGVLRKIIPGLEAASFHTKRCLITYTTETWPYVDRVTADRIYVATGGNGMGAKSSDAIGKLAADLVFHDRWTDDLDPRCFRANFEDAENHFEWAACGMANQQQATRVSRAGRDASSADAGDAGPSRRAAVERLGDAPFEPAAGFEISRFIPGVGIDGAPFNAAWAIVKPGEATKREAHHEAEVWIVVEGRGILSSTSDSREVLAGDVIKLPPFVEHSLGNPDATRRCVFITLYWQDMAAAARSAAVSEPSTAGRVVVTVTPPTPNGDLHLGHFGGPYAGADIHARYLRMKRVDARLVTGSDDFQSYVAGKALRVGKSPADVADHYAARIEDTLRDAGVRCDLFMRSMDPVYVRFVQRMVAELYDAGHVVAKASDYLITPGDGRRLFEFYVAGGCKHCGAPAGGGACEECGRLNEGVDLSRPTPTLGGAPLQRETVTRLVLPLDRHRDTLQRLLEEIRMPTRLRALAEGVLRDGPPDIAVTHPHGFGIPCAIPGFEGQVVSSWFEMGHNMLEGARRLDRSPLTAERTELVQFFGYDNALYYTLLYPLLYRLTDPTFDMPTTLVCNEFYLLDGAKFSTSRNHAVWLHDALPGEPVDALRFYLAYARPELERTNFTMQAYHAFVAQELLETWESWLHDLGRRIGEQAGGLAPEPGVWTDAHRRHFAGMGRIIAGIREGYEAASFSTRAVTRGLMDLVRVGRELGAGERHWAELASRRGELRTALALELAAARALAQYAAPIMPEFSERLWSALGGIGTVEAHGFDPRLTWVESGARVKLAGELFAHASGTDRLAALG